MRIKTFIKILKRLPASHMDLDFKETHFTYVGDHLVCINQKYPPIIFDGEWQSLNLSEETK